MSKLSYVNFVCDWEGCEANQFVPASGWGDDEPDETPEKWTTLHLNTVGHGGRFLVFCPLHGNLAWEKLELEMPPAYPKVET